VWRLEEQGDSLTKPRPVDHNLYFPTAEARAAFLGQVAPLGFSVAGQRDHAQRELPFQLELVHTSAVELATIHAVVIDLAERAEALDGEYDGWGCVVQKE
jgi:hypothetical protein